jgi:Protein of unknown function (DUF4038)/Putative collagen-binding domain of a collagenase
LCVVAWASLVVATGAGASSGGPGRVSGAEHHRAKAAAGVAFPLEASKNGRYLVDQNGVPFLVAGDSPQAMFVNLSVKQAASFLRSRKAAGFNTIWVNLLDVKYTGGRANGTTFDGIRPFTRPGDLATPNPAYFARVDAMMRLAAKDGFLVFLDPIEVGGWLPTLLRNHVAADYAYGRYVGRRYAKFANIVWLNGNDAQYWQNPIDDGVMLAVARGIKSVDPKHLQTVELNYERSSSHDDARWRPLLGIDSAYTYFPNYAEVLNDYDQGHVLPSVMIESSYEDENRYSGPETLRRQEYWSALSGATGQFYGNHYTWSFGPGWQSHLNTPSVAQFGYLNKLLSGRPWYALVPDQRHRVVTAGYGTFAPAGDVNTNDYVSAARTPNGKLVLAYLPDATTITVDMSALSGPVDARWFDPSAGTYSAITDAPFPNTGTMNFTSPGPNHDDDTDWVLVLSAS